jgi:hypothetical protein
MSALLSKTYVDRVYIPSGLLVVGCLIVKREWVPYAVVVAALLSGYKLLGGTSKDSPRYHIASANRLLRSPKDPQTY